MDYHISGITDDNTISIILGFKEFLRNDIEGFLYQQKLTFSHNEIADAALQIFAEKTMDSDGFSADTIDALKKNR